MTIKCIDIINITELDQFQGRFQLPQTENVKNRKTN